MDLIRFLGGKYQVVKTGSEAFLNEMKSGLKIDFMEKLQSGFKVDELRELSNLQTTLFKTFYCNEEGKEGVFRVSQDASNLFDNVGMRIITSAGLALDRVFDYEVKAEWFGAKGDGIHDDAEAINSALFYSRGKVLLDDKVYFIGSNLYIPQYKTLSGIDWSQDDFNVGSTLLLADNVSIIENEKSTICDLSIRYRDQDYKNPKFYTNPTVQLKTLCTIRNINIIGSSGFVKAIANVEKVKISNIFGCVYQNIIDIESCTDIPYISDIHFNPNSLRGFISEFDIVTFVVPILCENLTAFKFGHVDDNKMNNIFVYACKRYVHTYIPEGSTEYSSGDFQITNFGVDICHEAFLFERTMSAFGISISNGFATPLYYIEGQEQALVKLKGNHINGTIIKLDNVNCLGYIPTNHPKYPFWRGVNYYFHNESIGTSNHILVSNSVFNNSASGKLARGFDTAVNCSVCYVNCVNPKNVGEGFQPIGLSQDDNTGNVRRLYKLIKPTNFKSNWINKGGTATPLTVWKDVDGNTNIVGTLDGTSAVDGNIIQLPSEYVPLNNYYSDYQILCGTSLGVLRIYGDGNMVLINGVVQTTINLGHIVLCRMK
ncbi:hypothetical protein [Flectobacillus roseus]|uniref:Pectate lyase superfamily protein domain-containing protein n=1 Tax=Flectobacillus roseus TaxID=502259 RepID=A0ABT6Y3A8_9BACT|nr:hypothetical protein [Flectobacillus roseus]MDI9858001.1 hypothetical protein [Flectobacillus roseus]